MIRQREGIFLHFISLSVVTFLTIIATTSPPTTAANTQQPQQLHLNLPLGIFNLDSSQSQSPNAISSPIPASSNVDDGIDVYVPYRSDSHDQFSWQLLKQVLQEDSKNTVVSPFLVKLAVALLSEAAGNNTQTQRELIINLTDIRTPDNLRSYYKKILTSLKKENPNYTLNLETKLYTDAFVEPKQRFAAILQNYYYTDIARLPFDDPQSSADTINSWCRNITRGKLQQLVDVENVRNNIMLIVNVIYFNGLWKRQFNNTFSNVFFKTPSEQIKAEYMEQTEYFYYHDSPTLGAKILRLPYKGKSFSMFILLPTTNANLDELMQSLENEQLKQMQWMMEEEKLKVTVPKFKFDYNKDLKSTLNNLGIQSIFTDNASLPGLARGADVAGKLKISNIFQKAGIDVNELGTEAYASTVVEIVNKFGGATTIEEFNVNRPFIFFIEDELSGNILFAGKVIEPLV